MNCCCMVDANDSGLVMCSQIRSRGDLKRLGRKNWAWLGFVLALTDKHCDQSLLEHLIWCPVKASVWSALTFAASCSIKNMRRKNNLNYSSASSVG